MNRPRFTVGITTYKRHEELKRAIDSVLQQTHGDLEVLVGNDYQGEVLTTSMLGISDPRVRILNYPRNLREIGNMNALLAEARGRYFTWMADDDFCSRYFLEAAAAALDGSPDAKVVFTSFQVKADYNDVFASQRPAHIQANVHRGDEFIADVLQGKRLAMGLCGVYETDFARNLGGIEPVAENGVIGVFAEYLLLAKLGTLPSISFVDLPLTYYRVHDAAWSATNKELDLFHEAGLSLIRKSIPWILKSGRSPETQKCTLTALLKLAIQSYAGKYWLVHRRAGVMEIRRYVRDLMAVAIETAGPAENETIERLFKGLRPFLFTIEFKAAIKSLLSDRMLRIAKKTLGRDTGP